MTEVELLKTAHEQLTSTSEDVRYSAVKVLATSNALGAIPLLMRAVGDSSYRIREQALNGICSFHKDVIFPRLEDFLRNNENANLRTAAMEAFPRYGKEAVPYLLQLLHDYDEEIRMFAASLLGDIKAPSSVEFLIEALDDPDENVQHAAAESLGKIKDTRAVKPLISCLNRGFWVKYPAVIALGEIQDPSATLHLIELLDDEMVRQAVIEALGKIGDPAAIPVLAKLLSCNDPLLRNDIVAALVNIQHKVKTDTCLPSIKKALANEELIEHLLNSLRSSDIATKKNAVIALGWLKEKRALPTLLELLYDYELEEYVVGAIVSIGEDTLPALISALSNPDPKFQISVIRCLEWIGHIDGIKACLPLLSSDNSNVRYHALLAMSGALELEEIENGIIKLLNDIVPEIQQLLIEILGKSRSPRLVSKLISELDDDKHPKRILVVQILGRMKNPEVLDLLISLLDDENEELRAEVYKAISAIRGGQIPSEIINKGLNDKSPLVRKALSQALHPAKGEIAENALLSLLKDPAPEVRMAVIETWGKTGEASKVKNLIQAFGEADKYLRLSIIRALGNIADKESVQFLNELAKNPEVDIKRTAIESLGKIKDKRAVPILVMALDDPDWSIKSSAIRALGEIGDKRCYPHLLEKLDDPDDIIKKEAILALAKLGAKGAVNFILPLLHKESIQLEVINALEKLGISDVEFFDGFFERCNAKLKCLLVDAIGRLKQPHLTDFLIKVIENDFFTVRSRAAKALGEIGGKKAFHALLMAQKNDPSEEVRKEAAIALQKLDAKK